jgi:hypothetical protein
LRAYSNSVGFVAAPAGAGLVSISWAGEPVDGHARQQAAAGGTYPLSAATSGDFAVAASMDRCARARARCDALFDL